MDNTISRPTQPVDKELSKPSALEMALFSRVIVIATFALVTCLVGYHLGADVNWDLLNYHFYNGYLYTHGKLFSDSLATVQSYLDPLLNSFYYFLISALSPLAVNMILATMQSFALSAVFFFSTYVISDFTTRRPLLISTLLTLSALIGPVFWSEIGGTMGDTLLATPVIVGIFLLTRYVTTAARGTERPADLAVAGLLIGFVSGLKFTQMTYALAAFLSLALILGTQRQLAPRKTAVAMAIFSIAMVCAFGSTYANIGWLLWRHFHNPIFPYFNNIFHSPYMAPHAWRDKRWIPTSFLEATKIPFSAFIFGTQRAGGMEIHFRNSLFALIFILLIPYAWRAHTIRRFASPEDLGRAFFITFFLIAFIVWALVFGYYRYLAVLELLAPLALFTLLCSVRPARYTSLAPTAIAAFVFAAALSNLPEPNWGREPFRASYFGLNRSTFRKYQHCLLIIGQQPMGFILPYFPDNTRIIGIPENIGFTRRFLKTDLAPIYKFHGPVYYLVRYKKSFRASLAGAPTLAPYHLRSTDHCTKIQTTIFSVALCKVEHINAFPSRRT